MSTVPRRSCLGRGLAALLGVFVAVASPGPACYAALEEAVVLETPASRVQPAVKALPEGFLAPTSQRKTGAAMAGDTAVSLPAPIETEIIGEEAVAGEAPGAGASSVAQSERAGASGAPVASATAPRARAERVEALLRDPWPSRERGEEIAARPILASARAAASRAEAPLLSAEPAAASVKKSEPAPLALSTTRRVGMLAVLIVPLLSMIAAGIWYHHDAFAWTQFRIFATMFFATVAGIGMGYHRLFTHASYKAVKPVKWLLAVLGSMAWEGPLVTWVATHRIHHQNSDKEGDPHSPYIHNGSRFAGHWGRIKGGLHAHFGWLFDPYPADIASYGRHVANDSTLKKVSDQFFQWAIIGLLIPAAWAGLSTWSWRGALWGFVWGGLIRVGLVLNTTFSINSVCHIWGRQAFRSRDESRNVWWLSLFAMGENWHNTHHAFPSSPRHGLKWWQFDPSYYLIVALSWLGLASQVKEHLPKPAQLAAKALSSRDG